MSHLPSSSHMQQSHAHPKSGEELEMLGKQASSRYLGGASETLSSAVIETVKKAGLSPEQVKRVIEFANTDAFLQEFRKEGSEHRVIEFHGGPANYSDVLKDLNDGGGGSVFDDGHDYKMPPASYHKTAMANLQHIGLDDSKLAAAFFVGHEEVLPFAEPFNEAMDMRDKVAGALDTVNVDVGQFEVEYLESIDLLHQEVKRAALEGHSLGQVISAWQTVAEDTEHVKVAFSQLAPRLIDGGVFSSRDEICESLSKTASVGSVNPEHPLIKNFSHFCDTIDKLAHARVAQHDLEIELKNITTFLNEVTKSAASVGGFVKGVGGAAKKVFSAADKVAPDVGKAGGKAVEVATRYAPHAALLYGAHKAHQGMERSPTGSKILSFIPGTKEREYRQYNAAMLRQGGQ